jgi:hypothetical protein
VARRVSQGNISNPYAFAALIIILALSFFLSLAITVAIYAPPIILFCGLLYYQLRIRPPTTLTVEEAEELESAEEEQGEIAEQLWQVEDEALRFEVKDNLDGTYHRGSKRGVRLNKQKEEIDERWSFQQERITEILNRVEKGISIASYRSAFRWTAAGYCLIGFSLFWIKPAWLEEVSLFAGQHGLAQIADVDSTLYGAALIAGISAIVLVWLTHSLRRQYLRAKTGEEMRRLEELDGWQPEARKDSDEEDDAVDSSGDDDIDDMSDGNGRDPEDYRACYEALGVPPTATRAEIEAAFHIKIKETHPDLVARLAPEFQALADQMTKRLNAAREEALRRL